jgi:hypothetical protein
MSSPTTPDQSQAIDLLAAIVAQYDAAPDGPLGKGFTNGPFLAARDFLASLDSPDVQLLTDTLGSIWEATPDDFPLKPNVQLYRREIRQ